MESKRKKIVYLDGLKVVLCYMIFIFHFFLAFCPVGFVGYGMDFTQEEALAIVEANIPMSLFTNSSLMVYVFLILIAFIVTVLFYRSQNSEEFLKEQGLKRYFRFIIPCSVAMIANIIMTKINLLGYQTVAEMFDNNWCLAVMPPEQPIWDTIRIIFVDSYLMRVLPNTLISPLWCLYIIFLGSMITYGFLFVFGKSKMRFAAYGILSVVMFLSPTYLVFLFGIMCGDFFVHNSPKLKWSDTKKEIIAWILLVFGIAIGSIPSVYLNEVINTTVTYSVGAALCLEAVLLSSFMKRVLSMKWLVSIARYSFSVMLVHFFVMFGVSYIMLDKLNGWIGNFNAAFLISLFVSTVMVHFLSIGFYYAFEKPSIKLANYVVGKYKK